MIEINLVPDVKQEFIHAQKMRNTVITFAIIISIAAVGVLAILGLFYGTQALRERIARDAIKKEFSSLREIENVDDVLTIQNQMSKIASIHQKKTVDSRLFDIISAINPAAPNNVKIASVLLDPQAHTLRLEGSAENGFAATETFRKTILNTKLEYRQDDAVQTSPLTEEVQIGETSYGENADGSKVLRFSVSFAYPAGLFDNTWKLSRIVSPVGQIDVTDSRTRVPESLFSQKAADAKEEK